MTVPGRHPTEQALSLFAGGDLSPLRKRMVGRHVARCEACRATVAAHARIRERLARAALTPDVDFEALSHRIRKTAALDSPGWDWRWRAVTGMAAVAAACAAVLLLPERVGDGRPEPAPVTESMPAPPLHAGDFPLDPTESQITPRGGLSVRSFDAVSGTLTITDYFAP